MLIFKFACKWAVSKKFDTGFAQIFVCEKQLFLFGSHLRFKGLYRILNIKLRKYLVFLQNSLKIQNKGI